MGDVIQEQNWTKVFVPSLVLYVGFFHICRCLKYNEYIFLLWKMYIYIVKN